MLNHISVRRKEQSQEIIKRKIAVLEGYVVNGLPEGTFVPTTLSQFRLWEDLAGGLVRLGSPNTLDRPHNRNLKIKALKLIKEIRLKQKRKKKQSGENNRLRARLNEMDQLIVDLTNQWHASQYECQRVLQNERRLKNRMAELLRENSELTRKISTVVPLRSTV